MPRPRARKRSKAKSRALAAAPAIMQRQEASIPTAAQAHSTHNGNAQALPPALQRGTEQLSGHSMANVAVHYNSALPEKVQAHAFAQGNDIHLAAGQEKHLPHEAWHVVQQKEGRVQAQTQFMGKYLNNDQGLEAEATRMGQKAWQLGQSSQSNPNKAPKTLQTKTAGQVIQRSHMKKSDAVYDAKLDTPFGAVAAQLNKVNTFFPLTSANSMVAGNDPVWTAKRDRPKKVVAYIKGARRMIGGRDANNLSAIMGNLGNQELLFTAGKRGYVYAGGHLVGDQLLPDSINSFEEWNLAPQHKKFNAPVYEQILEAELAKGPINDSKLLHDKQLGVTLTVELTYPQTNRQVSYKALVDYGVVRKPEMKKQLANESLWPTTKITYPTRIPKFWKAEAVVDGGGKMPNHKLTETQQSRLVADASTHDTGPGHYKYSSDSTTKDGSGNFYIGGKQKLTLLGVQGAPSNAAQADDDGNLVITSALPAPEQQTIFESPWQINAHMSLYSGGLSQPIMDLLMGKSKKAGGKGKAKGKGSSKIKNVGLSNGPVGIGKKKKTKYYPKTFVVGVDKSLRRWSYHNPGKKIPSSINLEDILMRYMASKSKTTKQYIRRFSQDGSIKFS